MKNKVYAGYINLRPINGVIFPSYSQNQINKNFIEQNIQCNYEQYYFIGQQTSRNAKSVRL